MTSFIAEDITSKGRYTPPVKLFNIIREVNPVLPTNTPMARSTSLRSRDRAIRQLVIGRILKPFCSAYCSDQDPLTAGAKFEETFDCCSGHDRLPTLYECIHTTRISDSRPEHSSRRPAHSAATTAASRQVSGGQHCPALLVTWRIGKPAALKRPGPARTSE